LIQGHQAPLGNGFPGVQEQLSEDAGGAFRFLVNLPGIAAGPGGILPREQALRVAEYAGEWVAQFVGHAADHLAERREFFSLQQLRVKQALGGQVAVDFHAPGRAPKGVQHGFRGALQHARCGAHHLQFLAHASLNVPGQFPPMLGEALGFGCLTFQPRDQILERPDLRRFLGSETCQLLEP
jgi:hypothetical protein